MPKPTLYIMCGLPFSGKTTLARSLASFCSIIHIDLDAIARARLLFPEEGIDDEKWSQMFREAHRLTVDLLSTGKSVVFDAVNYDRVGRDRLRSIAQQTGSFVYVVFINLSVQEIEQRRQANQANNKRPSVQDEDFSNLSREFEIPTAEENPLVFDGTLSISEWIKQHICCEDGVDY